MRCTGLPRGDLCCLLVILRLGAEAAARSTAAATYSAAAALARIIVLPQNARIQDLFGQSRHRFYLW